MFHMLDWVDDLEKLHQLFANPTNYSVAEAEGIISGFLYHAPGHIVAAARLYDVMLDPFQIGAAQGEDDA